jgi:hypothetical protein
MLVIFDRLPHISPPPRTGLFNVRLIHSFSVDTLRVCYERRKELGRHTNQGGGKLFDRTAFVYDEKTVYNMGQFSGL